MSGALRGNRRDAIKLAAAAAVLPLVLDDGAARAAAPAAAFGPGRDQPFDLDWRFLRSAGEGLEAPGADDAGWRRIDLPHDWSIEDVPGGRPPAQIGPFDKDAAGGTATGFTIGGEGWYRKRFRLGALPPGARAEVLFDGVAVESEVWLNGHRLGSHVHAYTPFAFDLTPHLNRDGENVLAVRVRNIGRNSRWYAGSGIYRQVRLDVWPAASRIARWGVGGWTRRIDAGQAEIDVRTRIEQGDDGLTLVTRLRSAQGRVVAEARGPAAGEVRQTLAVRSPALWSPDAPVLYTLESELRRGATVIDRVVQPFGIRIVTMDATDGLRINGAPTKLRGGCIHHDNGLLGARAFADADDRRIALLKARGFNAIRSAHNPPSATLRAACDAHGMLLIAEAFDMWHARKLADDYSSHIRTDWQGALTAMVLSARNSPSVILWSIGNEIPDRSTPEGMAWCWKFANLVRMLDPTRPVTAGLNGVLGATVRPGAATARAGRADHEDEASTVFLDVAGYNYELENIEARHAKRPDRVIYASETFARDACDYQRMMDRLPYMLGEFVWTAMDYVGEAGIAATARIEAGAPPFYFAQFPWVNAWCGDIDLIGQQKPQSLARDVVWGLSPIEILVERPIPEGQKEVIPPWGWWDEVPSWTWPDAGGRSMNVRLYSAGDRVELRLNGTLVGTKPVTPADKMRVEIAVPYAPGTLEAIAYRGDRAIGRKRLETIGAPATLRLTPERMRGRADRQGLLYIDLAVLDAEGRVIPEGAQAVALHVTGPAELAGFGSADPLAAGSFQAAEAKAFRGRALAIVRSTGSAGSVRIEARAAGLTGAAATVRFG